MHKQTHSSPDSTTTSDLALTRTVALRKELAATMIRQGSTIDEVEFDFCATLNGEADLPVDLEVSGLDHGQVSSSADARLCLGS